MRVLHQLTADERLLSRGLYHYLQEGKPSGQVERWQISRLPDGHEIVRADVDGRQTPHPYSLITHLLRRPDGRPVWLRLRYLAPEINAAAQYSFEADAVRTARQATTLPRRIETLEIAANYVVDYPPVIGHDFPWRGYPESANGEPLLIPIFSPDLWAGGDEALSGRVLRYNVRPLKPQTCAVPAGTFMAARRFRIIFSDGVEAVAWFDEQGIPLRWFYPAKGYDFVLAEYVRAT